MIRVRCILSTFFDADRRATLAGGFQWSAFMTKLRPNLACWNYDRTRALADRSVQPEGIDLYYLELPVEETSEPRAEEWPTDNIPPPKPAITVGLDGGYIRSRDAPNRNEGWFEVIAGKSTVRQGSSSCFAFVHRPALMSQTALNDPGNAHGVVYTWGTHGIGHNRKAVAAALPQGSSG
jgi:hypothetical protein